MRNCLPSLFVSCHRSYLVAMILLVLLAFLISEGAHVAALDAALAESESDSVHDEVNS